MVRQELAAEPPVCTRLPPTPRAACCLLPHCCALEPLFSLQVGGRSVVNKDITQYVEIRPEEDRFLRLLELLGEW